jgi:hypothetical protein
MTGVVWYLGITFVAILIYEIDKKHIITFIESKTWAESLQLSQNF